jgi:hypothetical protein
MQQTQKTNEVHENQCIELNGVFCKTNLCSYTDMVVR